MLSEIEARLEKIERENQVLREILESLWRTNQAMLDKQQTEEEELTTTLGDTVKVYHEGWFNEYKQKLSEHQAFWAAFSSVILTLLVGTFWIIEDAHVRDTMAQEASKIEIILEHFKESLPKKK